MQVRLSLPTALSTIGDAATIAELGNTYLSQVESENTAARLVDALMANPDSSPIPVDTDHSTLQRLMAEKVQNDFETGETVVVIGWVLSRTEARQSALFSLTQAGA